MDDKNLPNLPFLTRDMLKFGKSATFALRVTTQSTTAEELEVKGFTRSSIISIKHTPAAAGSLTSKTSGLDDFPIYVSVNDPGNAFGLRECYVVVDLIINGNVSIPLISGYLEQAKGLSWPNNGLMPRIDGGGNLQRIAGANPAAGSEAQLDVPVGQRWLVRAVNVTLVTDANAANRTVSLKFSGGSGSYGFVSAPVVQTASTTVAYFGAPNIIPPAAIVSNNIGICLPEPLWIDDEGNIATITQNKQAGDDFAALSALVEIYYEPE